MASITDSPSSASYERGEPGASSVAHTTGVELYRIGDATGSGLDAVRSGIDVSVIPGDGGDWVKGTPQRWCIGPFVHVRP